MTNLHLLTQEQVALWQKIENFVFDEPNAEYPFSLRLADEQGWSMNFTERVINEYRRFLFLSAVCEHMVSPSETIDEAWHLHLIYTESYQDFCQNILEKTLHHLPSKGGKLEKEKYQHFHLQTKESYAKFFGETLSDDIWDDKVPTFDFTYLKNDSLYFFLKHSTFTATLLIFALTAIFYYGLYPFIFSIKGIDFVYILLGIFGISLAVIGVYRFLFMPTIQEDMSSLAENYDLNEYETASLNVNQSFEKQYLLFVLTNLHQKQAIKIDKKGTIIAKSADYQPEAIREKQVWAQFKVGDKLPSLKLSADDIPDFQRIKKFSTQIQEKIVRYYPMLVFEWLPLVVSCIIVSLGLTRLLMGIENNKPSDILALVLVFMILILLGLHAIFSHTFRLFEKTEALKVQKSADYVMFTAFVLPPYSGSSGGSSDGGGCGGGGCGGGGCGGCGGCGG